MTVTTSAEPYDEDEEVLVVAARAAWPLYQTLSAYLCQNHRFFRPVSRLAFYADRTIYPAYSRILARHDDVDVSERGAARLLLGVDAGARPRGRKIREVLAYGWEPQVLTMFELTGQDDPRTLHPAAPIRHNGRSGWTMGQRYARLGDLMNAQTTDEFA